MATLLLRVVPPGALPSGRARGVLERNFVVYRHGWMVLLSGFFEPLFYLLSIGVGLGKLVPHLSGGGGTSVSYPLFVAPALLAASAMNGALFDSTFNVFYKLKYVKVYDAVLSTPVTTGDVAAGEIGWALLRGSLYAVAFLVVMAALGLAHSFWTVLALPAAVLVGFAFAACGMAGTTFMRSWQDFEFVQLTMLPLFLFSATFYPLTVYPPAVQAVVRVTPLYQGVALMRALAFGRPGLATLGHAGYLVALGAGGCLLAARRLQRLLLR